MSIIGVVSMKGGVGKTSVTANLAFAIASKLRPGQVSVVDLDPQNALHWHFGSEHSTSMGICGQSVKGRDWHHAAVSNAFGINCLPYGDCSEAERKAFEDLLSNRPNWVGDCLKNSRTGERTITLIDSPPGPSVYLRQIFACADLILVILISDAASYATIPSMESWINNSSVERPPLGSFYVLNQVESSDRLSKDVVELLHQKLGEKIVPVHIHHTEAVGDALAFQQPVLAYDPQGLSSHDFTRLATWTVDTLHQ